MNSAYPQHHPGKRLAILAITFALHAALLLTWRVSTPASEPASPGERIVLWFVRPAPPKPAARPRPVTPVAARRSASRTASKVRTPSGDQSSQAVPSPSALAPPEPVAAPAPSAQEMVARARRDLAGIDKEIRKDMPRDAWVAPVDTPHKRMARAMARAAEMARPGFFEAPKITVLNEPGPHGRKLYRVTTAMGTYCIAQDGQQALNGSDRFGPSGKERRVNCPDIGQ